jgi:signal transduction histidine kinase
MSEEHPSADPSELQHLRALLVDYETKMTDAVSLVARVRHEINNPLAALLGQAQLLLREELGEKSRARVEAIEKLAIRISEIVTELRNVQTRNAQTRNVQTPVAVFKRAEE